MVQSEQVEVIKRSLSNEELSKLYAKRFENEWDSKTTVIPYSRALKDPREPINVMCVFKINLRNTDENLHLASIGLVALVENLNHSIDRVNGNFKTLQECISFNQKGEIHPAQGYIHYEYQANLEMFAYTMKNIVDKTICLMEIVNNSGKSDEIKKDSIGALVYGGDKENKKRNEVFCDGSLLAHHNFLYELNNLHNSYKHTFSNLQIMIADTITPAMKAIYKPKNSSNKPAKLCHMLCVNAVKDFDKLLISAKHFFEKKDSEK